MRIHKHRSYEYEGRVVTVVRVDRRSRTALVDAAGLREWVEFADLGDELGGPIPPEEQELTEGEAEQEGGAAEEPEAQGGAVDPGPHWTERLDSYALQQAREHELTQERVLELGEDGLADLSGIGGATAEKLLAAASGS